VTGCPPRTRQRMPLAREFCGQHRCSSARANVAAVAHTPPWPPADAFRVPRRSANQAMIAPRQQRGQLVLERSARGCRSAPARAPPVRRPRALQQHQRGAGRPPNRSCGSSSTSTHRPARTAAALLRDRRASASMVAIRSRCALLELPAAQTRALERADRKSQVWRACASAGAAPLAGANGGEPRGAHLGAALRVKVMGRLPRARRRWPAAPARAASGARSARARRPPGR